jgi:hypothetical protein
MGKYSFDNQQQVEHVFKQTRLCMGLSQNCLYKELQALTVDISTLRPEEDEPTRAMDGWIGAGQLPAAI